MTNQRMDSLHWNNKKWTVLMWRGGDLPRPSDFGLNSRMCGTGNYRGYWRIFVIDDERLTQLSLNSMCVFYDEPEDEKTQPLGSDNPVIKITEVNSDENSPLFGRYRIQGPSNFTGRLIICRDYDRGYMVKKPHNFRTVFELVFDQGQLIDSTDHTQFIRRHRFWLPCRRALEHTLTMLRIGGRTSDSEQLYHRIGKIESGWLVSQGFQHIWSFW